ncbi:50S ribosomal protein L35 [bacterium]|nr:50S ribosomal protein L35 [bacterium]MBU1600362.1 50S ribosomal protein L35 [bacterium]MBU2461912.1 50S ribosomal protein L35 [bacterium]
MLKHKSHRGLMKRVKVLKNSLIKRSRANRGHLLTKKSAKRKRRLGQSTTVAKANMWAVKRLV